MAFSIAIIIIIGLSGDYLFKQIKLPGLVGMLLVGICVGPFGFHLLAPEMLTVSADFRKIALIIILLRSGFELRRDALHQVGRAALIMSCLPAVFEIIAVMVSSVWLLKITWLEAALLGTILAAVSPAVVVPLMIEFMDRGRGAKKGIPTLLLGASSLDDVFVIVLFTVFLGIGQEGEIHILSKLAQIPVSVISGILIGLFSGYVLYRLFSRFDWRPPKRTLIVIGFSILLTQLEVISEPYLPIASLLGVMALGFIILEKSEPIAHIISQKLKKLWVFAELLLFVLVGAQVNIQVAWKAGLAGTVVILIGLVFRSLGTWLSLYKTPFTRMEKIFCVVAYVPKATVQAAIGAVPLAAGFAGGEVILAVAVLSIIITAPLGAIGIKILGERILDHGSQSLYYFKELRKKLELPHAGERVRHKKSGKVWKIIEEKEVWLDKATGNFQTLSSDRQIPAIYIRYWRDSRQKKNGRGKTISQYYSNQSASFNDNWEILYDW